jgi:adenine-specific DNA glycosylase
VTREVSEGVPRRRRGARWYHKKSDDSIIERWAAACSRLNEECRDCPLHDDCQDLADRLIGCISVRAPEKHRQRREMSLTRN